MDTQHMSSEQMTVPAEPGWHVTYAMEVPDLQDEPIVVRMPVIGWSADGRPWVVKTFPWGSEEAMPFCAAADDGQEKVRCVAGTFHPEHRPESKQAIAWAVEEVSA